jgi:hypothetical protein
MRYTGDAVHYDFERNRDLLLDLFGGSSRPLGDDFNIVVCHVRVCFDRKLVEGNGAPCEQQNRHRQHDETIVESKIDETSDHRLFPMIIRRVLLPDFFGALPKSLLLRGKE